MHNLGILRTNFYALWVFGNHSMLKACDVEEMKSGKIKLSCMRKLMFEVGRAARFVNQGFLLKANMSP